MSVYNPNPNQSLQQQLQELTRQYQQLLGQSQAAFPVSQPTIQQVPIPVPVHQIQYVEGIAGARLYQDGMPPNSSEIIVDKDEDIFYKVLKDANGIPSKKIIRCGFTILEDVEEEPTYLTRKDFDDFKEEIRQLLKPAATTTQKAVTTTTTTTQKKT